MAGSMTKPAGCEPEATAGSSSVPPGGSDDEPSGCDREETSDVPPGAEKPHGGDGDEAVIIRTKVTGPSAVPLSLRRPPKTRKEAPSSPPAAAFFSGKETEEEVALSKVPTPKKSRPFPNMAMPQKPAAGQDGLWRCNICNISTFRSQVAFDRHWNLH